MKMKMSGRQADDRAEDADEDQRSERKRGAFGRK